MPKGCKKEVLEDILKYWDSPSVKEKSKRNSANRNKGPKATWYGGRKSTRSWKKTLEKENKKSDPFAVFEHTHSNDHDGKTFTNPKAKGVHDKYLEIHARDSQSLPDTQEPRTVDPKKTYFEATGGPSHGRFFGLGAKAGKWYGRFAYSCSLARSIQEDAEDMASLREQLRRQEQITEEANQRARRIEELVATLFQRPDANSPAYYFGAPSTYPPSQFATGHTSTAFPTPQYPPPPFSTAPITFSMAPANFPTPPATFPMPQYPPPHFSTTQYPAAATFPMSTYPPGHYPSSAYPMGQLLFSQGVYVPVAPEIENDDDMVRNSSANHDEENLDEN